MNELKILNKLNNELDKQLNKEDSDIMTDMVCYIRAAGLSDKDQELIRQDLLEMALSAQERNEAFSITVGKNYKEFCDDIISSMPKMTKMERLLNLFSTLLLCGSILLMISTLLSSEAYRILKEIFKGGPYNFNVSYSFSTVVLDIIITIVSIGIVQYICKTSFESIKQLQTSKSTPKKKLPLKRFLIGAAGGGLIWIIFFLIVKFGSFTVATVNIFVAITIAVVMFLLHKLIALKQ